MNENKSTNEEMEMFGLADCYGIEYFGPIDDMPAWLSIRAQANRHRHALSFKVMMTKERAKTVITRLREGEFAAMLSVIKASGTVEVEEDMVKSWDLIPNPDLDPYGPRDFGEGNYPPQAWEESSAEDEQE